MIDIENERVLYSNILNIKEYVIREKCKLCSLDKDSKTPSCYDSIRDTFNVTLNCNYTLRNSGLDIPDKAYAIISIYSKDEVFGQSLMHFNNIPLIIKKDTEDISFSKNMSSYNIFREIYEIHIAIIITDNIAHLPVYLGDHSYQCCLENLPANLGIIKSQEDFICANKKCLNTKSGGVDW